MSKQKNDETLDESVDQNVLDQVMGMMGGIMGGIAQGTERIKDEVTKAQKGDTNEAEDEAND